MSDVSWATGILTPARYVDALVALWVALVFVVVVTVLFVLGTFRGSGPRR